MPDTEKLTKWVEALRSGQYGQVTGRLGQLAEGGEAVRGFCCLGVLCEVARKDGLDLNVGSYDDYLTYDGEESIPPHVVKEWVGLAHWDVVVPTEELTEPWDYDGETTTVGLTELNDSHGWSFKSIADAIEDNYLKPAG